MPGFDERLKQHLERLAPPADPSGAFDRILEKKIRRRVLRRFQAAALAVVVVVATVGGTFALVRAFRSTSATERLGGIRPIRLPAANGRIAYHSFQDGGSGIWTINADGAGADKVTPDSLPGASSPTWSPDGKWIAFVSESNGSGDIYAMKATGGSVVQLTHDAAIEQDPAWAPDGSKIAYTVDGQILVMKTDGSGRTRVTTGPGDYGPTWAPDGSWIAFARVAIEGASSSKRSSGIYKVESDGGTPIQLTRSSIRAGQEDLWPDWSSEGDRIVFVRNNEIYAISDDGSDLTKLTSGHNSVSPTWSPDGKKIAFERILPDDESNALYVMNAEGSNLVRLPIGAALKQFEPDWQPLPAQVSPPPSPQASPIPTPSPLPAECDASQVTGNFDGDGQPDTATVAKTDCLIDPSDQGDRFSTEYSLRVRWPPSEGMAPLPDCGNACVALASTDLNIDGIDEFILKVDQDSSSYIVQVYELPASEAFGDPARMVPPGAPGFPPDQAAQFGVGGSVTAFAALGCMPGNNEIIVEIAKLDSKQTEYAVHTTVLRFDPIESRPFGQFTVTSTEDRTEPYDNEVGPGDRFEPGGPCWMD